MYNITITIKSGKDVEAAAQEIALIIEQATGEQCRVSVVDHGRNRLNQSKMAEAALYAASPSLMDQRDIVDRLEPRMVDTRKPASKLDLKLKV